MKARKVGKKWDVRLRIGGEDRRFVSDTERGAVALATMALLESEKRGRGAANDEGSLESYADKWLENVQYIKLKPGSWKRKVEVFRLHIFPAVGHVALDGLGAEIIQTQIINPMVKDGLSYSTVKKAYNALTSLYSYAIYKKDVKFSPCDGVTLPPKIENERQPLTDDEAVRFVNECLRKEDGAYYHSYGPMFVVMLNTGIRPGEARALRVCDVGDDVLKVSQTMTVNEHGRNIRGGNTKTGNSRAVALNQLALGLVREMSAGKATDTPLMMAQNGKEVDGHHLVRSFHAICRAASISDTYTPHCLRHTYATMMFENGYDAVTIQKQLGHKSISTTLDIYTHSIKRGAVRDIKKMEKLI